MEENTKEQEALGLTGTTGSIVGTELVFGALDLTG